MENLILENNNLVKNELEVRQNSFLKENLSKIINTALDIGLKAVLPDFIETQIIDVKNCLLENGMKEGINQIVSSGIETGKSAIGIMTGTFDNLSQMEMAVKKGGILDNFSSLIDFSLNIGKEKNLINNTTYKLIKNGKDTILKSVSDNIQNSVDSQIKVLEKLEKNCISWNKAYENHDVNKIQKAYKNIRMNLNKVLPIENIISKARQIEAISMLLEKNGYNFSLDENTIELAKKFA